MPVTMGSLFDGIGGFPLAAMRAGITPVWASEIEPFPVSVTKHHFPNMKHLGDITQINGAEIEPVDVITFGSPCQDLSVAGKREGLGGERSGLFSEAIRIIRAMREATDNKYPRFIVWENVPGAFSSNNGADFRSVLEEITETEISIPRSGKWASAGMVRSNSVDVAWRVLDAQYWGVPQRRKRIFLVADFGGQCAAEILFKPESLPGYSAEGKSQREGNAGSVAGGTGAADGCLTPWDVQSRRVHSVNGKWPALYGGEGGGHGYAFIPNNAAVHPRITGTLCASGAGLSRPAGIASETDLVVAYSIAGNSIDRKIENGCNGRGVNKEVCFTLNTIDRHAVAFSFDSLSSNSMKSNNPHSGCRQVEVAKCLDTTCPEPSKNQGGIAIVQPIAFGIDENNEVANTLLAKANLSYRGDMDNLVSVGYAVRRLTPVECERLQGFPDGWTDIPGASDTARYKALGNSIAVPCVQFIMGGLVRSLMGIERRYLHASIV